MKDIEQQLELISRGADEIINIDELKQRLIKSKETGKPLIVKAGFDPTAPDIHLGHSVLLRKMRHFQYLGHKVVFLIGDFTGRIGDPSGKSKIRKQLTEDEVMKNAETYKEQVYKILDKDKTVIEFNSKWNSQMKFSDVLSLTSRYTVARMLERDDFAKRYKNGIPIAMMEFMYPLVQGYDSVALKTDIELGGTDQKFNLLVGRDLMREYGLAPQLVLTMPLLEGTDGVEKMSKSLGNYVGINEEPKDIYGKLMSIPDNLITRYMELTTDIPMDEIKNYKKEMADGKNPRDVKARLAYEIVKMYHSEEKAVQCQEEFTRIFKNKGVPDEMPLLEIQKGMTILDILKLADTGESVSQLKRLLQQGSVTIDNAKISDQNEAINTGEILKIGKRSFFKLIIK